MIAGQLKLSINNILSIIRIKNVVIALLCIVIAFLKINESIFQYNSIITSTVIILLMMGSNIINDIYDISTDRINRPNRVLIQNPHLVKRFSVLCGFMILSAILLSFLLSMYSTLIVIASCPFLIFYSKIFKKIPIVGNLLVSFFLGLVFIFVAISSGVSIMNILPEAFIAFSISFIREIVKDVEDFSGDKESNINTTAVFFGVKQTVYISCFLIFIFFAQCAYFINYDLLKYYTLSLILLIFLPLFYLTYFLIKSPSISSCAKAAKLLKKVTFLGLLIIYIM